MISCFGNERCFTSDCQQKQNKYWLAYIWIQIHAVNVKSWYCKEPTLFCITCQGKCQPCVEEGAEGAPAPAPSCPKCPFVKAYFWTFPINTNLAINTTWLPSVSLHHMLTFHLRAAAGQRSSVMCPLTHTHIREQVWCGLLL